MDSRTAFHVLLLRPLLKLIFGLHVQGARQLEGLDRFLIVANHNSHLDTLLLMSVLPRRRLRNTHPVAAADHFGKSPAIMKLMNRFLAPVWIDRGGGGEAALEAMDARLAAGGSLILFPEGSRGDPGEMQRFRTGVGHLLERHPELPVIPAHILGPERALPRGASLPLPVWNRVLLGPARRLNGPARNLAADLEAGVQELARAESARRQQRRVRRRDSFTVAALGIDGSGKSTLARNLAADRSSTGGAALIGDELRLLEDGRERDLQPLSAERLRRRLSRRAKSARSLAGYKIPKLAELLLRDTLLAQSRRWYDPAWIVMDGSPLLNLTAWSILYREEEFDVEFCGRALGVLSGRERLHPGDVLTRRFPLLRWLQGLGLTRLEMPDAAVFIDLAPEAAVARIDSRGESKQVHETPEKLAKLRRAYLAVCEAAEARFGLPVLRLDGTHSPEALTEAAAGFLNSVKGDEA